MIDVTDRVAVVTGSGQGIGRAIAWGLADAGCDVVLNARRIDDLEVTRKLKDNQKTRSVPVVMLTAKGESRSIFRAQEMGATDYLIKPMNSEQMLKMLARHA